jgi:4-hydroxy-tetrahydrodipicolinate synthase
MVPSGLIAFPITPMDAAGRVDAGALRRLVRRLIEAEVDAVCVLGSTGSYPFLARDERRRAIEAAADETAGRLPLFAGVGALRTDDAILCAQDARLLHPPHRRGGGDPLRRRGGVGRPAAVHL